MINRDTIIEFVLLRNEINQACKKYLEDNNINPTYLHWKIKGRNIEIIYFTIEKDNNKDCYTSKNKIVIPSEYLFQNN